MKRDWVSWNMSKKNLVIYVTCLGILWLSLLCQQSWVSGNSRDKPAATEVAANKVNNWEAPPAGVIKVNVDGAVLASSNGNGGGLTAASGGLMRDCTGEYVGGFMFNMGRYGSPSFQQAQSWAVLWGLKLAWDHGYRHVQISSSHCSLELMERISERRRLVEEENDTVIREILELLHRDWNAEVVWCSRESNQAAHILAKQALNLVQGYYYVSNPPQYLTEVLSKDVSVSVSI